MGIRVPVAVSRLCRERRATLGWVGNVVVVATDPHHKLPSAYLRERLLVLHLQVLFQGGVEFPTGGKSGGAKGVPWRRRGACGRTDESATRVCVGSHAGRTGEIPVPTVRVRMKEAGDLMSEQSQHIHFENTNRWSTKQLVTMALMCALGALFMYVQLPILPSAPFLTYDPSLVPAMVCGFAYGPGAGTAVAAMAIVIHALTTGDWVGALMNLVATLGYILPAAIVYQKMHTYKGAVIGLVLGVIAATALSMVANLTIGVWFWYGSVDVIAPLMIPAVLPFNLIKTVLNSVLTLAVYKAVSNLITPKKDQVKGRA